MAFSVADIINGAIKLKKNADKVAWLKQHECPAVKVILRIMYDKTVEVLLPNEKPPYKPSDTEDSIGLLHKEANRLRIFIKGGGYDNLNPRKRETLFIELLEAVDKDDAVILCKMIAKKNLTGLPRSVINEAYNNLLDMNKDKANG